jgi:hypothetical protein
MRRSLAFTHADVPDRRGADADAVHEVLDPLTVLPGLGLGLARRDRAWDRHGHARAL